MDVTLDAHDDSLSGSNASRMVHSVLPPLLRTLQLSVTKGFKQIETFLEIRDISMHNINHKCLIGKFFYRFKTVL